MTRQFFETHKIENSSMWISSLASLLLVFFLFSRPTQTKMCFLKTEHGKNPISRKLPWPSLSRKESTCLSLHSGNCPVNEPVNSFRFLLVGEIDVAGSLAESSHSRCNLAPSRLIMFLFLAFVVFAGAAYYYIKQKQTAGNATPAAAAPDAQTASSTCTAAGGEKSSAVNTSTRTAVGSNNSTRTAVGSSQASTSNTSTRTAVGPKTSTRTAVSTDAISSGSSKDVVTANLISTTTAVGN